MRATVLTFLGLVMVAAGAVLGSGCHSIKATPAGFASVEIRGNTPGQISRATVEVFRQHEYSVAEAGVRKMVFEKKGSRWNNLAYGNWIGDTPVYLRVKAWIVARSEAVCHLKCQAYLVRDKGGATEEELPVNSTRRAPYQKLLDEVASRFTSKQQEDSK